MNISAFTRIELLVVIAIVVIIAGLALPLGTGVSTKDKGMDSLRRLRQLGIGTDAYLADNNNQIFSDSTTVGWPAVLHSNYVPNWKVFKSPFDSRPDGNESSSGAGVPVSYGINANILARSSEGLNSFAGNPTNYTSPSLLIYMAPNVDPSQSALAFIRGTGDSNVSLNPPAFAPATRADFRGTHASRSLINVLFADGHVGSISYQDFATTTSADGSGQARWQPIYNP